MSQHFAVIEWPEGPGPAAIPTVYTDTDPRRVDVMLMRELSSLRPEALDADPNWLREHPAPAEDDTDAVTDWLDDFAADHRTPRFTFYAMPEAGHELIPVE